MRTLIDIPEDDLKWLDRKAADEGRSRAAVVREAVAQFRAATGKKGIQRYFGLWKDRGDVPDGLEYQRKMRSEWDREWDVEPR
jgi:hypothetical protein